MAAKPGAIDCFLFDLDGTLVDSRGDIAAALDEALAAHGLGPVGVENVLPLVGNGARALVERAIARVGGPVETADAVLETYLERYGVHLFSRTTLYPGVVETLEALEPLGVRCGLVTNKPREFSASLLEHFGIARHFCSVVGGDTAPALKPSPAPVLLALAECGATAGGSAMVGDGDTDMRAGKAAGLRAVGVTYGYRPAETLLEAGADVLVASFVELLALVDSGGSRRVPGRGAPEQNRARE